MAPNEIGPVCIAGYPAVVNIVPVSVAMPVTTMLPGPVVCRIIAISINLAIASIMSIIGSIQMYRRSLPVKAAIGLSRRRKTGSKHQHGCKQQSNSSWFYTHKLPPFKIKYSGDSRAEIILLAGPEQSLNEGCCVQETWYQ